MRHVPMTPGREPVHGFGAVLLAIAPAVTIGACTQDPVPEAHHVAQTPGTANLAPPREAAAAPAGARPQEPKPAPRVPVVDGYEIVATYPHDTRSFTQGLVFDNGRLLESQGQYGESSLRLVELETGKVLKKLALDPRFFGEGVAVLKGLVYQLTWKEHMVFVYTAGNLEPMGTFRFADEGWGLTTDGTSLIASTGGDELRFIDPKTLAVTRKLPVRAAGLAQYQINELEWIEGEVWANVWHSDRILRIDPKTGEVTSIVDLKGLLPDKERPDPESVLNGIAYDAAKKRIFVTGKRWPKLFEIRVKKSN